MKPTTKTFFCLLLFIGPLVFGQMGRYDYKRQLKGVSQQWHKIILPNDVFGETSPSLTDLRIFGITESNDTIEAPYLLRLTTEKTSNKEVAFNLLNTAHNKKGYYFTFEVPATEPINQIELEFARENFDWRVKLEGSQNQEDWFTILENYRILSIKNGLTDFQFTKLKFPNSKYRFYRVFINSRQKPELVNAGISLKKTTEGKFRDYAIEKFAIKENRDVKQTEIHIELQQPVPVSYLKIEIKDTFDYYRPVTIDYLVDSIKTEKGWILDYETLTSGTLNSIEKNEFKFNSTVAQKLKILVHNQDNQPLTIDTVQVKGYVHELVARFTEPATYFLVYGNKNASSPQYDIKRFSDKIPKALTTLELGEGLAIEKEGDPSTEPLFKNKAWLWTIMGLIILLLGWFSLKMIRRK